MSEAKESYSLPRQGIHGVQLKKFEEVVADILPSVKPEYSMLPPLVNVDVRNVISNTVSANSIFRKKVEDERNNFKGYLGRDKDIPPPEWPFNILPLDAGCRIDPGKLPGIRAVKKEYQVKSLIQCVLAMIPLSAFGALKPSNEKKIRIVDFAGGSGHLALPLAVLLPKCDIVIVDLKGASLTLAHKKAENLATPSSRNVEVETELTEKKSANEILPPVDASPFKDVTYHANKLMQSRHLPNLYTFHGSITKYIQQYCDFDIGIGLHACGEASDVILRACGSADANFIVSPCCVGTLSKTKNRYI